LQRKPLQGLHAAHGLHSVSKNAAVSGATAPKPPTNLCALIATFILPQKSATGGSSLQVRNRSGASPAPKRKQSVSWKSIVRSHRGVLLGMDFFTTEVLTLETANGEKPQKRRTEAYKYGIPQTSKKGRLEGIDQCPFAF
jgi:hypothetical protein